MKYALSIGMLVLSFTAQAEGMLHVPPWTMTAGKACYEFQDAKKLLILDADLEALIRKDAAQSKIVEELKATAVSFDMALEAEKSANLTLSTSNMELGDRLLAETKRANNAEAKPGVWPAWAIAGGVGLAVGVIAGVVLGVYVAK